MSIFIDMEQLNICITQKEPYSHSYHPLCLHSLYLGTGFSWWGLPIILIHPWAQLWDPNGLKLLPNLVKVAYRKSFKSGLSPPSNWSQKKRKIIFHLLRAGTYPTVWINPIWSETLHVACTRWVCKHERFGFCRWITCRDA